MHPFEFYIWNKGKNYIDAHKLALEKFFFFSWCGLGVVVVLLLLVVTRSSLHPTFWILREQEAQHCSSACTSVLSQNRKELKHCCIRMNSSKLFPFRILKICHAILLLKWLSFSDHSSREVKRTYFILLDLPHFF